MSRSPETNGNTLSGKTEKLSLTDREQEILSKAWNCMRSQPEIDYEKLAAECGMTNVRSASNAWSALKKKLFTGVPPTPRGKKAAATDGGDGTPGAASTSEKRKRATPSKKKAILAPGDDEDDELANANATPTKRRSAPRKKATPAKVEPKAKEEEEDKHKELVKSVETVPKSVKTVPKSEPEDEKKPVANEVVEEV